MANCKMTKYAPAPKNAISFFLVIPINKVAMMVIHMEINPKTEKI
jgi:hypothetical protein